ncbi:MAG: hypothetical protein AVDCRST_MAG88-3823 [uncultured Thermomicrobiales bacterium]|uniref:NAD(P)-binding domain-containing protein n=1 Tax=uncultured Thermomicrobiales bacterium TaxID=1645740 RepID=A0A6J4VR33_9BACT|nr:MAG: hypothetical protein AVDCRST_MAG88-3823 [uncultured Thermomicrobiales bacterium]
MSIAFIGATGGTGRHVVEQALPGRRCRSPCRQSARDRLAWRVEGDGPIASWAQHGG